MQVTETQIDELTRQFTVAVPLADIERKVAARLNEMAHQAKLPGFRPGKVPIALLRKRYGASVMSEAVEEAINESSQAVISERGLRAATPPKVELSVLPEQGDLEFTMAVEILPDITPPDYGQISLERLVAEVDAAEVEQRLLRFAEAMGEEAPVAEQRPIEEGDLVEVDVLGPEDRWPFGQDEGRGVRIRVGQDGPLPGLGAQLQGLSAGAKAQVSITFGDDVVRKDLIGQTKVYDLEIKQLRTVTPAPLDDELAKKGGFENLDELKTWISQQQENDLKQMSRLRLKRGLLDRLAELYHFAVPKSLLEREYEVAGPPGVEADEDEARRPPLTTMATITTPMTTTMHGHGHVHGPDCDHDHHDHDAHGHSDAAADSAAAPVVTAPGTAEPGVPGEAALDEAQRQEYRSLAERRVRLGLVLAEIGRTSNLRVTQEEIGKAMIAQARRFPGQEQAVLEFLRKNQGAQEALAAPILEEKVIDFILEMAKVRDRSVSVEDLLREDDAETTSTA